MNIFTLFLFREYLSLPMYVTAYLSPKYDSNHFITCISIYILLSLRFLNIYDLRFTISISHSFNVLCTHCVSFYSPYSYTGWPRNNGTVDTVDFSGLCSNQQLFSSLCWIEHLFPIIITPRSSNLVENFLFYETFLMDCHFRDLPDFQIFEAR